MKKGCPICQLSEKEQDQLWHLFHEDNAPSFYEEKSLVRHFKFHRVKQPPCERPLRGSEALLLAEKLPERLKSILLLLQRNPGLSLEQIATCLYLEKKETSAISAASRDLKRLMLDDFVYRVFLEDVAGESLRPRNDVPALYFLGVNARSFIHNNIKRSPIKREEWLSYVEDLPSWQDAYQLFLSREIPKKIVAHLDLKDGKRGKLIGDWHVSFDPLNWISPFSLTLRDPLKTYRRINADGIFALSLKDSEGSRSALLPIFYYLDRGTKAPEKMLEMLLSHTAVPRSRALEESLIDFTRKTIAPVMCISDTPERRDLLLERARGQAPDAAILIASRDTLDKDLEQFAWNNLLGGEKTSLLRSALLVAGSSNVAADGILQEKPTK